MAMVEMQGDAICVSGDIDYQTVVALREQGEQLIDQQQGSVRVDMEAVGRLNTAALALLLSWQRRADSNGLELQYTNVPPSLIAIAEMSDLESLLN